MKPLIVARKISQALFLLLFIYVLWSTTYPLKGLLPPDTFFKIDPLVMLMTSLSEWVLLKGLAFSLVMLLFSLMIGRFFCGWVCPLGTAIDIVGACNKKKIIISDSKNKAFRSVKFYIFMAIGMAALLGRQVAWILDPIVIAARFVSLNLIPALTHSINSIFIILIRNFGFGGAIRDFYHSLKSTLLGVEVYYFSHSVIILVYFFLIVFAALFITRLWCRTLCPLGAMYALLARFSPLRRTVEECGLCKKCKGDCKMGAIRDDLSYVQGECILCMDCVYSCPPRITRFEWGSPKEHIAHKKANPDKKGGIPRKHFLFLLASSAFLSGFKFNKKKKKKILGVIRPPAALEEEDFLNRCVRCGNCMKVCITNGLQPVMFETGLDGIWTPRLVPEIGYCEYRCTLCGQTCPTGAISAITLAEKLKVRLGVAEIDKRICIPWADGEQCIVCQEHCPVSEKAIKIERDEATGVLKPYVDETLCVGCGICQNKCPVRPVRAIRVSPRNSDRTRAS